MTVLRRIIVKMGFPIVMTSALLFTWLGFTYFGISHILSGLFAVIIFGFILIPVLERICPYRPNWNENDDDVLTDFIHILLVNNLIVILEKSVLTALLIGGTAWMAATFGSEIWPSHWPLLAQLFLMLLIAEFGRYWIHYAAHKLPWLWRLHAVHHSPNRLYFFNAGRFHPIEKVLFQLPEVVPFILLGTNIETITLYFTFNTIHGFFQHSNIRQDLKWLNYIFSLPELHRWHHSKKITESDRNFGNNLIVWDLIFGTYYNPKDREVEDIGLLNPDYPKSYIGHLKAPFARRDISKPVDYKKNKT